MSTGLSMQGHFHGAHSDMLRGPRPVVTSKSHMATVGGRAIELQIELYVPYFKSSLRGMYPHTAN